MVHDIDLNHVQLCTTKLHIISAHTVLNACSVYWGQ